MFKGEEKAGQMLALRHQRLKNDVELYSRYPKLKMRILVSGSSGFVGREFVSFLKIAGHEVVALKRKPSKDAIFWDPENGRCRIEEFEGFDAIVHLAGENIASGLWTDRKKKSLFCSRCRDTWLLAKIISRLKTPPKKFICASALGYYGNRPEELVDENSQKGTGFLSDLAASWEHASEFLHPTKVIHARFGLILGPQGGALPRLLLPIRLGVGGIVFGNGLQKQSWIAIDDVVGSLYHLLHQDIKGPVVISSPNPVSQVELITYLLKYYQKKKIWKVPNLFGEMGKELLCASCMAKPTRLLETGYHFLEPRLEDVLW